MTSELDDTNKENSTFRALTSSMKANPGNYIAPEFAVGRATLLEYMDKPEMVVEPRSCNESLKIAYFAPLDLPKMLEEKPVRNGSFLFTY